RADALTMPPLAASPARRKAPLRKRIRGGLGRLKRAVAGPPAFYRPSEEMLGADRGHIERVMTDARERCVAEAKESVARPLAVSPDVFFCHEPAAADYILQRRVNGQQVWLMIHNPMPVALYLTWNWGVPEREWLDVMKLPDVQRWTRWEFGVWSAVDR